MTFAVLWCQASREKYLGRMIICLALPSDSFRNLLKLSIYLMFVTTCPQYLELRYRSAALRKLGTSVVLLQMSVFTGMCLYAPSLALTTVTSISSFNSVLIAGAIVTFYITVVSKSSFSAPLPFSTQAHVFTYRSCASSVHLIWPIT